MTGGLTYFFNVEGTNTLLNACCTRERRGLSSKKIRDKGHHTGNGKHGTGFV